MGAVSKNQPRHQKRTSTNKRAMPATTANDIYFRISACIREHRRLLLGSCAVESLLHDDYRADTQDVTVEKHAKWGSAMRCNEEVYVHLALEFSSSIRVRL